MINICAFCLRVVEEHEPYNFWIHPETTFYSHIDDDKRNCTQQMLMLKKTYKVGIVLEL